LSRAAPLSRRAGELLLRLLEQRRPVITAAALDDSLPGARLTLVGAGALQLHGTTRTVIAPGDAGPMFRELAPLQDRDGVGYFDAADGTVVVSPDDQRLLRVSLPWWLSWLAHSLDLANSSKPAELVPSHAWDIGDLWISARRKIPVLFGRRLHRDETCQALSAAMQRRTGRSGGLILTSSSNPRPSIANSSPFVVTSILTVLTNDVDNFSFDRDLVLSPYLPAGGGSSPPIEPLHLSPDGKRLVVNGVEINFRSKKHVAIVQELVAAFRVGQRLSAREVLDKADSAATTFRQAFGPDRWAELRPYLKSRGGLWGFEL
jgi:hypothetical protein